MAVSKKTKTASSRKTAERHEDMTEKVFVLDTNVLLHDPEAYMKFPRHQVVVPVTVIEELDKLKRTPGELGKSARHAIRQLDIIKNSGEGDLHKGVLLPFNGSTIRISMAVKRDYSGLMDFHLNDNKIILSALDIVDQGYRVVFVSKDYAARLKAEAVGLDAEDYENFKAAYDGVKEGPETLTMEKSLIDTFFKDGTLPLHGKDFTHNQYFHVTDGFQTTTMARYDANQKALVKLVQASSMWGIKPRNIEQRCAVDALLRDDIKLVALIGPAGTGKTLLALAAAMRKVFDEGSYRKILVSRPIVPLGRDIGYLPGTKDEKLSHWMQPIFDNLELLCASQDSENSDTMRWVMENKKIEMEAVTYIRGRSLPKMFIIIDEAQNLTPHEIKTIISRAGEGTKVVLCGDPTQIDNPYLDKDSNGLTYTFSKFRSHPIAASVYLDKTERSELAAVAAEIL